MRIVVVLDRWLLPNHPVRFETRRRNVLPRRRIPDRGDRLTDRSGGGCSGLPSARHGLFLYPGVATEADGMVPRGIRAIMRHPTRFGVVDGPSASAHFRGWRCQTRYVLRETMRIPRYSPSANIARSPVTMTCAPAASAHSRIRLSGSSARTAKDSVGSTNSPSSERKTATRASASRSWANFRARTERSSSRMGLERASESCPATILRSASSPRPPGNARADTRMFVPPGPRPDTGRSRSHSQPQD